MIYLSGGRLRRMLAVFWVWTPNGPFKGHYRAVRPGRALASHLLLPRGGGVTRAHARTCAMLHSELIARLLTWSNWRHMALAFFGDACARAHGRAGRTAGLVALERTVWCGVMFFVQCFALVQDSAISYANDLCSDSEERAVA